MDRISKSKNELREAQTIARIGNIQKTASKKKWYQKSLKEISYNSKIIPYVQTEKKRKQTKYSKSLQTALTGI